MEESLKGILLGSIQGLTEFLPISSTGHLVLARKWLGLSEAGLLFDTLMHLGTFFAVLAVFLREIKEVLSHPFSPLTKLLVAGTIPTALIGFLFADFFDRIAVTGESLGWEFLFTGGILWAADHLRERGKKRMEEMGIMDALWIGTLQGAAILPAISRSGLTLAGALFIGMEKEEAARFSFLLSIPSILGANLFLPLLELSRTHHVESVGFLPLILGGLTSFLTGYLAIRWMLNLLKRGSLKGFALYVWCLGGGILLLQWSGHW
ncbi:MAG: undecaprenyl-diphosphate phosphatase [Thermicanus sp.]|nr:undecaprenyl-diphosphate phosphatase [Thermicanus sp.]